MAYTALYRKFRPERFEDVKGQEHIVSTLKNQLLGDRIGHAYLFCGTRGTGKTTIAKLFAKAVNCEEPVDGSPCGKCKSCRAIAAGASMNVFEIDAASNNGVDNIRDIVEEVSYSPAEGRYKVYIIDEVHMLSTGAFNAMLKTLEEPPSYVIFILATTEVHKIPVTILSRCQRYDFKRLDVDTIEERLREVMDAEGLPAEEKALRYIARAADGSVRDSLSLLEQCVSFHYGEMLTYENALDVLGAVDTSVFSKLLRGILQQDVNACIGVVDEVMLTGREPAQFVADFTWYLRNLLLVKTTGEGDIENVVDLSADNLRRLREEAEVADTGTIMRYIRNFSELSGQIRYAGQKRILIEVALIRLCMPQMEEDNDALKDRIRILEDKIRDLEEQLKNGNFTAVSENVPRVPKAKPVLPTAVPEDVEQLVREWSGVVGRSQMPAKNYLKDARLSLDASGRLLLGLKDGLASDYYSLPKNKLALEELLSDIAGKQVEVNIQSFRSNMEFEDNHVDLTSIIHMDIEEM